MQFFWSCYANRTLFLSVIPVMDSFRGTRRHPDGLWLGFRVRFNANPIITLACAPDDLVVGWS